MKRQIRRGAFETNSSSTHAINIYRGYDYVIPKEILVRTGDFGWECEEYYDAEDKLAYLYTWCMSMCSKYEHNEVTNQYEFHTDYKKMKDYQYRIKSKLEELGVEEVYFGNDGGYIDHTENLLEEDLEDILENYFADFIFNDSSYIETGNDNDDMEVNEDWNADFHLYKGN